MTSLSSYQGCSPAEALHTSQGEPSYGAHRASSGRKLSVWHMESWNVRTLVDIDGTIETARGGLGDVSVPDERKVDQVLSELDRYHVVVAALQETKWFGCEVYRVGESVVLSAGREVPETGTRQRGEGVAIVLSGEAVSAWRARGSQWKAWSSRLITSKLVTESGSGGILHMLSCYAPTFVASREEKNKFFNNLQDALSSIPPGESLEISMLE